MNTITEESLDSHSDPTDSSEDDNTADDPDYISDGNELPVLDELGGNLSDDFQSSSSELDEVLHEPNNMMSCDNDSNDITNDPVVSIICLYLFPYSECVCNGQWELICGNCLHGINMEYLRTI